MAARSAALVCASPGCPKALSKDCTQWAQELQNAIPTILLEMRGADGSTPLQARMYVDGATTPLPLAGTALPFDPGEHVVRIKAPGVPDVVQRFVAFEGDRGRRIVVNVADHTQPKPPRSDQESVVPLSAKVSGAVAVAAFVGAGVFAWRGLEIKHELDETGCRPACESARVDQMAREFLVADIALGVGAVASLAAGYLWWSGRQTGPTASLAVGPQGISLRGGF